MTKIPLEQYALEHDLHKETVRLEAQRGKPGFYRIGRKWFWSEAQLLADTIANAHKAAMLELANVKAPAPSLGPNPQVHQPAGTNPVPSPQPKKPKADSVKTLSNQKGSRSRPCSHADGTLPKRATKVRRNTVEPLPDNRLYLPFADGPTGSSH